MNLLKSELLANRRSFSRQKLGVCEQQIAPHRIGGESKRRVAKNVVIGNVEHGETDGRVALTGLAPEVAGVKASLMPGDVINVAALRTANGA